jgi:hypothetical protein
MARVSGEDGQFALFGGGADQQVGAAGCVADGARAIP